MKVDKLFGRRGWRRCLVVAAALGVFAGAGSWGPAGAAGLLHPSLPRGIGCRASRSPGSPICRRPRTADSAKDPCITATGQLRIDDRFLGTASLVLNRREVLTVSHVPAVNGVPHDRFSLLLGYDRGWTAFTAEATVVARGSYRADSSGGSHYRGGDWAIAVLDKPAPAEIVPLAIYQGQPEDLLGKPLWVQGYAMSYASSAAPFVAKDCAVRKIDPLDGRLHNDCGGDRGTSGAPLLMHEQGTCSVVGIEASGIADLRPSPYAPADRQYGDLRPQIPPHRRHGQRAPRCRAGRRGDQEFHGQGGGARSAVAGARSQLLPPRPRNGGEGRGEGCEPQVALPGVLGSAQAAAPASYQTECRE